MTRYLIVIITAILAACTYSMAGEPRSASYPETMSGRVRLSFVSEGDTYLAPGSAHQGLSSFARHVSVTDGVRGRVHEFEVLYHAPNRHAGVAAPYQPASVPDRLMIMSHGEVLIEATIAQQFAGTLGSRSVEVAQLNVRDQRYLLVTANSEARNPLWLALYTSRGKLLYRAALEHGGYRFVEHADGFSILDHGGHGKRITLL